MLQRTVQKGKRENQMQKHFKRRQCLHRPRRRERSHRLEVRAHPIRMDQVRIAKLRTCQVRIVELICFQMLSTCHPKISNASFNVNQKKRRKQGHTNVLLVMNACIQQYLPHTNVMGGRTVLKGSTTCAHLIKNCLTSTTSWLYFAVGCACLTI